jgi:hypothetical protein
MRVSDHALLSTTAALAVYPLLGRKTLVAWAASIFIDVDHFAWFALDQRSLNPLAAARFFNQAQPPQHLGTRRLHSPDVMIALGIAGLRWPVARLVLAGIVFHGALDVTHKARLRRAREATLARDGYTCRWCGARDATVVAHVWRQPVLLPSYRTEHLVSLCGTCHEKAHTMGHKFTMLMRSTGHVHNDLMESQYQ